MYLVHGVPYPIPGVQCRPEKPRREYDMFEVDVEGFRRHALQQAVVGLKLPRRPNLFATEATKPYV